jgi:hypothetical protein
MKKSVFLLFLLCSLIASAQKERDSLLQRDYKQVESRLILMHHLDRAAVTLLVMDKTDRQKYTNNFPAYFLAFIAFNNEELKREIFTYLDDYTLKTPEDFIGKVNEKNAQQLIEITEKYGYPSAKRIKVVLDEGKILSPVIFAIRPNTYHRKLSRLLKKESKSGNISTGEYSTFSAF